MIALQVISLLVLLFVIVMIYACTIKLINDHNELHALKDDPDDQVNLDVTDKQ